MYKKYQHIERWGHDNVSGIELGSCTIFHKIDGTNASVWWEDGMIKAGSRKRELSLEQDNAGFYNYIITDQRIENYLAKYPTHRLFGEYLVPHTIKHYSEDAWRRFYVFDVCVDGEDDELQYIPYNEYKEYLDEFDLDYIPPIKVITNGSYDDFVAELRNATFLMKDEFGAGEGIVIKNYDYKNKFGKTNWAKIVSSEFKTKHVKTMGCPEVEHVIVEEEIVKKYVTKTLIDKEYAKIVTEKDGWSSKYIPMLFGRVWNCLIVEEMWSILKDFKNPTINFKHMYSLTVNKIKEIKPDMF